MTTPRQKKVALLRKDLEAAWAGAVKSRPDLEPVLKIMIPAACKFLAGIDECRKPPITADQMLQVLAMMLGDILSRMVLVTAGPSIETASAMIATIEKRFTSAMTEQLRFLASSGKSPAGPEGSA